MKTLEELGISPAPWRTANAPGIASSHPLMIKTKNDFLLPHGLPANARLIAAAPELYEALAAIVSRLEAGDVLTKGDSVTDMVLDYAKKALAKAAGESEVTK